MQHQMRQCKYGIVWNMGWRMSSTCNYVIMLLEGLRKAKQNLRMVSDSELIEWEPDTENTLFLLWTSHLCYPVQEKVNCIADTSKKFVDYELFPF